MADRRTLALHDLAPDLQAGDAPAEAWNDGHNVYFKNLETVRAGGDRPVFGERPEVPRTIISTILQGTPYWVWAGEAGVFAWDGVTATDVSPEDWPAAQAGAIWTSCTVGGLVVVNRSDADPVWWPGGLAEPCEPLPGWPAGQRCIAMRSHKGFLFAVGVTSESENVVAWSDVAEPGAIPDSWDPTAENLAGFAVLTPGGDACLDGRTLRDSFVIYKGESVWSLDFVADTNVVFAARQIFDGAGLGATNGVTGGAERHVFLDGSGDVRMTDGASASSILDGRAQRRFYGELATFMQGAVSSATLERQQLAVIAWPTEAAASQGAADRALIFDMMGGEIGFRDLPMITTLAQGRFVEPGEASAWDEDEGAWDADVSAWNAAFSGAAKDDVIGGVLGGGFALLEGAADALDGSPVEAWALKQGLSFGDAGTVKFVPRIWPKVRGQAGEVLTFRVGGQETPEGAVEWGDAQSWVIGSGDPVDVDVEGRFLALEVSSLGGEVWRLASVDWELEAMGRW